MSKNYQELSNQVAAVQTTDHTLAVYCNLEPVAVERFEELIDGKVKIFINDFSKGKGDASVCGYFNLDLKDVKFLHARAQLCHMPTPLQRQKIHGAYPINEGPYKGMCNSFHITIARNASRRNPWNITISNGVAVALPGRNKNTYYEKSDSYQQLSYVYINLSDVDFYDIMDRAMTYIREYTSLIARTLIPRGLQAMQEVTSRNTYSQNAKPQENAKAEGTSASTVPPSQPAGGPPVTQASYQQQPAPQVQAQAPASKTTGATIPTLHPTTLLIQSPFHAFDGNKFYAQCMIKGNTYNVFFDEVTDELIEAQMQQKPITLNIYMDSDRKFRCYDVAA